MLRKRLPLIAFAAVFAALAIWIFLGTWSPCWSPVMPDDQIVHPEGWSLAFRRFANRLLTNGKVLPCDLVWDGFLFSQYAVQEFKYALAAFFAALGLAYYLKGRGYRPLARFGAALFLGFSGYWFSLFSAGHGGWFRWMTYGVFAFGLADRAVRRGKAKNWLLLGAVMAWGSFYQPDLWLLFSALTFFYFVWCHIRERVLPDWKGIALAALAFVLIGAPGLRSAYVDAHQGRQDQIKDSKGTTLTGGKTNAGKDREERWIFVTNWSLPVDETAEFFIPRLNGDTSCPLTLAIGQRRGSGVKPYTGALGRPVNAKEGNYRQHSLYVGWMTCLFALAGAVYLFVRRPKRTDLAFFLGAAVLCWLLSLGRGFEPLYRLVFALPVGDSIRCPVKWHHLTELSIAVLAAAGIAWAADALESRSRKLLWALAAVIVLGAVDLARVDRLFVAPVDLTKVREKDATMQMTFIGKADFSRPEVASMMRAGMLVPLAYYPGRNDVCLVEVLKPRDRTPPKPLPPMGLPGALGLVSLVATLAVGAYGVRKS